jgi:hypothetical protein
LRVTPGSTTQSKSSAWTATILFIRDTSTEMPPAGALRWPSSDEPVPKAMTGVRCVAQTRTISATSSVLSAKITASGGWLGSQVVVWPCCSRTAADSLRRSPNRCFSTAIDSPMPLSLRCANAALAILRSDPAGQGNRNSPVLSKADTLVPTEILPFLRCSANGAAIGRAQCAGATPAEGLVARLG